MNPFEMFKNIGKIQSQIKEMQGKIDQISATGTACGDSVSVTLNGKFEMTDIRINPEALNSEDMDLLSPLIKAAHADAVEKIRTLLQEQAMSLTNGADFSGFPGFGN